MTASEAKQKVLAVYPDAYIHGWNPAHHLGPSFYIRDGAKGPLNSSIRHPSEASAWIDAASKLSAPLLHVEEGLPELEIPNDEFMEGSFIGRESLEHYLATSKRKSEHWERAVVRGCLDLHQQLTAALKESRELRELLKQWTVARPIEEYHEDLGCALWFKYPIDEPPYVGTPNDCDWPDYHTHFVRLTNEIIPVPKGSTR